MDSLALFESHRCRLRGLAYRMLGSRAEADDVVQDTWLRWQNVEPDSVADAGHYLTRIAANLCLDRLKSAVARRETYIASWLPEPVVDAANLYYLAPDVASEFADDISFALMLALERLSPAERAAFLLHDVFDYGFDELAVLLHRTPSSCRKLASRARAHVRDNRPRFTCGQEHAERIAGAFAAAVRDGDASALERILAADATFISDGGGQVAAIYKPLRGRHAIVEAILGFARRYRDNGDIAVRFAEINGLGGFVMSAEDGSIIQTMAFEPDASGLINVIYVVRNPNKLTAVH